jgi:hypothetical protein
MFIYVLTLHPKDQNYDNDEDSALYLTYVHYRL